MLTNLVIKNFALIDDLQVALRPGMTVITGETGAGKSIILDALGLLLGKRADLSSVKNDAEKCVVEAQFQLENYNLDTLFDQHDLDYDAHTIIRREILPSGKSRAFVNDSPVTLSQLQKIAPFLVDIHSQHETLQIASEDFQLEVVDALAGNEKVLREYREKLQHYRKALVALEELKKAQEEQNKELDYNSFLLKELQEAHLEQLDQQALEESQETLSNMEAIREGFIESIQLMDEESIGTLETSKSARLALGRIKGFSSVYEGFWQRLNSAIIEMEDLLESMRNVYDDLAADPELLEEVNAKLQNLYKLQQKHGLSTVAELIELQTELEEKVGRTLGMDEEIEKLKTALDKQKKALLQHAKTLHESRKKVLPELKKQLETILVTLGLPNANLQFELESGTAFRPHGIDSLELLFSANKGIHPGPLKKVASGGEMSRIMLAIKSVLARYKNLPTLVFDEIDTGVSGEIAAKMGEIMMGMSKTMQLLTITHLPQVAARGETHLKIYKEDNHQVTQTHLKELQAEERVIEIATMLGGNKISEAALANAKELLN